MIVVTVGIVVAVVIVVKVVKLILIVVQMPNERLVVLVKFRSIIADKKRVRLNLGPELVPSTVCAWTKN